MSFPHDTYWNVLEEAREIVRDRDAKGRNHAIDFYAGFPHGSRDVSFELSRRVGRILGCEVAGREREIMRGDAIDLLNYAAFYVMLLDREASGAAEAQTELIGPPMPPLRSI